MSETPSEDQATSEPDPLVGLELGNYKIVELIGEGGMGAVYAARHPVLGREVAVKVLSRKFCDEEDFLARFRQEALAANRVGHEVIVEATDFGSLPDGRSYYVMERLQGESLGVKMDREGAISLAETASIIVPVMDALQAAHESGVIHRDLKPDNIFLHRGRNGEVQPKLLDFGLAKMLEVDKTGTGVTTQTGLLLGTPLYMPPEQFSGKPETLGPWTDVYALAGVIYHMLAARPPYDEHGFADLLMKHMQAPIPSICDRKADLPQTLDDALQLALAKKPKERFQNMRALQGAFEAAVRSATELGIGATILPTDPPMEPLPRPRAGARDIITVAARKNAAETVAMDNQPAAAPKPPGLVDADGAPQLTAARAISAEMESVRESQTPSVPDLKAVPKLEQIPEPEPEPEPEPGPESKATPAALSFDDDRPGATPRARATPTDKETVVARPKPAAEPPSLELDEPAAPKRGGAVTVILVLLLLAVLGGGGYFAWRHFQPAPQKPAGGTLMVDAQPKGALIRIDNETQWAPSPVTRKLAVGSHRVTIKKAGFDPLETWVSVRAGRQTRVALDLLPSSRPAPPPDSMSTGGVPPTMEGPAPDGMGAMTTPSTPPPPARPRHAHGGSTRPPRRRATMTGPPRDMAPDMRPTVLFTRPPDLGAAIRRVFPGLQSCMHKAKPGDPALTTRMRIAFRVAKSGKVTSARLSPRAMASTPVGRCLVGKVRRWKLPPYPNGYGYAVTMKFK